MRAGGRILLVGLGDFQVPLVTARVAGAEIDVRGSFWGTSLELREVQKAAVRLVAVP